MTRLSLEQIAAGELARLGLKPPVGGRTRETLWASDQPGFGVRSYASGRRVYVVQARMHGVSRTVTLCSTALISRRDAVQLARRIILRAQVGESPADERARTRAQPSFAAFLKTYWARVAPTWKPSTRLSHEKYRRLYIEGAFAGQGVQDVDESDVVRWFAAITQRGSPGAANRTLAIISALFNKAIEWGKRPAGTNPARGVRRNRGRVVERHLNDAEFARLGAVLKARRDRQPLHVAAVELLLLTGCRRSEVLGLQWSEVRGSRLLLTDSKTGPRTVWLGREARTVLAGLPRSRGCQNVFCDPVRNRQIDLTHFWQQVMVEAQLGRTRIHDIRHSFASRAAAASETLPMIGKLLGHAKIASTARYAHLDDRHLAGEAERTGRILLSYTGEPILASIERRP